MHKAVEHFVLSDGSLREISQKTMETEAATKRFYEQKAASADDEKVKNFFSKLARQETSHYLWGAASPSTSIAQRSGWSRPSLACDRSTEGVPHVILSLIHI